MDELTQILYENKLFRILRDIERRQRHERARRIEERIKELQHEIQELKGSM